ncbi:acyltransferase family protein [Lysinibacillus sp. NPDC047702]|uniref:acyltransferase family protein n=1 Tax=unclassified Lysinibacillus TaxID=2636778 RepID=UPI003D06F69F
MFENTNRIRWIDTAKGLGIIIVILGHAYPPDNWLKIIYSFHMPLFFFLSGYLFSVKKYNSLGKFISNKSRSLLIPYFIFSILSLIYYATTPLFISNEINWPKLFVGFFYSNGISGWLDYNVALWFLTCLFVVEIIFYFILKKITSTKLLVTVLLVFSIVGYLDSIYMPIRLPWSIDIAFSAIVFFGLGYISKTVGLINSVLNQKVKLLVITLPIFLLFINQMIKDNYIIDMNNNRLNDYYNFYTPAICGILLTIIFASLLKSNFIEYLGKNSLVILATHLPIIFFVSIFYNEIGYAMDDRVLRSLSVTFLAMLVLLPIIYFINRYTPFILGKKQ